MNTNGNNLLDKVSELDPKLIADAEKKPRKKRGLFIGLTSGMATVAAAAVIAVAAGHGTVQKPPIVDDTSDPYSTSDTNSPGVSGNGSTSTIVEPPVTNVPKDPPELDFSKYKDLPKISGEELGITAWGVKGGNGGAASMTYAELERRSPWNGAELETMPVYMSSSNDLDLEDMYAYVKNAAAELGIPEGKLEITDSYPTLEAFAQLRKMMEDQGVPEDEIEREIARIRRQTMNMTDVTAAADGVTLCLRSDYALIIRFDTPVELPDEYNFTKDASAEEKAKALKYLANKYKDLLGYANPVIVDENSVYDPDGELIQQVVDYWLNRTEFKESRNERGKLNEIEISSFAGCKKLDDYPILTAAQAEEILKSNKYSDEERMPADAKILKTDIVYSNAIGYSGILPYYKFYVETDIKPIDTYDIVCTVYSIAAVPEEFIDMNTEDLGIRA